MAFEYSPQYREKLKQMEGFAEKEYPDAKTGKTAIGYGFQYADKSKPMTRQEADAYLEERLKEGSGYLNQYITNPNLTQDQKDVLGDLEYNGGIGTLKDSGIIDLVNQGDFAGAAEKMKMYRRAKNATTGQYEELPALISRDEWRQQTWTNGAPQMQAEQSGSQEDMLAFEQQYKGLNPAKEDMLAFEKQYETQAAGAPSNSARLEIADIMGTMDAATFKKEAMQISEYLGISQDDAEIRLIGRKTQDVLAENRRETIAKYFPNVANWASVPENYVLMKENIDWPTRVEAAARPLNKTWSQDVKDSLKQNKYMLQEMAVHLEMVSGHMSVDKGKQALKELDYAKSQIAYGPSMQGRKEIAQSAEAIVDPLAKTLSVVKGMFSEEDNRSIAELSKAFDGSVESASKIVDFLRSVAMNPREAALMGVESVGSAAAPLLGAGTGFVTAGPIGAGVGAFTGGAAVAFGQYLQQELEAFRDPSTGQIDYDLAFSNPRRVESWRREGAVYGVTMGLVDMFTAKMAGAFVKPALKATGKGVVAKTAAVGVGLAKGAMVQSLSEGAGETVASTAADIAGGKLTEKTLAENIKEGLLEAAISPFAGATIEGTAALGKMAYANMRVAAKETVKTVDKANEATNAFNTLQNIRSENEATKASTENPQQTAELVKTALESKPVEVSADINEDPAIDGEIASMNANAKSNSVSITPSEWDAYHNDLNQDPVDAMKQFGAGVFDEYVRNKANDSSITMSIDQWQRHTANDPLLDSIARINGNDMNAIQAEAASMDLEKNPLTFFEMTAYHGSPYNFDSFSIDKIGTGEGAQAFGYGLYFTEDKDIAEYYRKATSYRQGAAAYTKPDGTALTDNEILTAYFTPGNIVPSYTGMDKVIEFYPGNSERSWAVKVVSVDANGNPKYGERERVHYTSPGLKELEKVLPKMGFKKNEGQTYEVNIKAEKDQMLDWGLPFEQQSTNVKEALTKLADELKDPNINDFDKGSTAYKFLANRVGEIQASQKLKELGVPGIKYLAQGGKSDKQNFVIFDDKQVEVSKKFYEQMNGQDVPPSMEQILSDQTMGDATLRPVELTSNFLNDEEKSIFNSLVGRMKATTKGTSIPSDAAEIVAQLEFRRMRTRARALGLPLSDVAKRLQIGKTEDQSSYFRQSPDLLTPYKIVFGRGASAKTLVHELGHSWLHEMAEDFDFINGLNESEMNADQRELKQAMAIASELLGVENLSTINQMEGKQLDRIHETFSQTTEKYFLEGKFANNRIRYLMESFRKYMTKIAEFVGKTYPQYPALKITPQVERMFEALLDANDKIEDEVYPMFSEPLFDAEMLGDEGPKYIEAIRDARSSAIGEVYAKIFRKEDRLREKEIESQLNNIVDQATAEVDQRKSMQILRHFQQAYEDYKKGSLKEDPRISYDSFSSTLADNDPLLTEQLRAAVPSAMVAGKKKGGIDIAQLMVTIGVDSVNDMMNLLTEAGSRDAIIQDRVNEIIKQTFPVIKTDEQIHTIASKAVHDIGQEKLLRKELELLAKGDFPTLKKLIEKVAMPAGEIKAPTKDELKFEANNIVMNTRIAKFSPDRFMIDSNRLGVRAAKLFRKGNIIEAFNAKRAQNVNFYAFKYGMQAMEQVAEARQLSKQFALFQSKPSAAKKFDVDIMNYGISLIKELRDNAVDLRQVVINGELSPFYQLTMDSIQDKSSVAPAHIDAINKMVMNTLVLSAGRTQGDMVIANTIALGQTLRLIKKVAAEAKQVSVAGKKELRADIVANITDQVGDRRADDREARLSYQGASFRMGATNIRTEFSSLFKNDLEFEKSDLATKVYNPVADAESKLEIKRGELLDPIRDAARAMAKRDKGIKGFLGPIIYRFKPALNSNFKPIVSKELGVTFDRGVADVVASLLHMGSESGRKKLMIGGFKEGKPLGSLNGVTGKVDDSKYWAFIDSLIKNGTLTKEHFDFVQATWDSLEAIYPDLKKSIRETEGRDLGYVAPESFKVNIGGETITYRGGYYPISKEKSISMKNDVSALTDPDSAGYNVNDMFPAADLGFVNTRTERVYPVDLDLSRVTSIVSAVANIAYLRPTLMNVGKILADEQTQMVLENRRPGIVKDQIVPWFERVKLQEYTMPSREFTNRIAKYLRHNMNVAVYLGSYMSVARQISGIFPAAKVVGPRYLSMAFGEMLAAPKELRARVVSKSTRMESRFNSNMANSVKSWEQLDLNNDWITGSKEFAEKYAFFFMQGAQNILDVAVWKAGYNNALDRGLTESQAISFADNAVEKSQSSSAISTMSNLQYGDDIKKLWLMFSSVPIAMSNLGYESVARENTKAGKTKAMMVSAMALVILPVLMDHILTEAMDFGDEDEDRDPEKVKAEKRRALAVKMLSNGIETTIPVLGRTLSAGAATIVGEQGFGGMPAVDRLVRSTKGTGGAIRSKYYGIPLSTYEQTALLDLFTIITGIPSSLGGRALKLYEDSQPAYTKADETALRREMLRDARGQ